ncbi:MAG: nucleoside triphosphate pyrophosphohydrolase, partial [Clostridia bacterium]|nr:nucleoside triphosphate pyrophosphohydrolase [Clostridia bacterium]
MADFQFKDRYNFDDLVLIMKRLRAKDGCPWDAEQTHESIKANLIEETYEVIEAINKKDPELLCEELGDV